jgi:hypothetical protein
VSDTAKDDADSKPGPDPDAHERDPERSPDIEKDGPDPEPSPDIDTDEPDPERSSDTDADEPDPEPSPDMEKDGADSKPSSDADADGPDPEPSSDTDADEPDAEPSPDMEKDGADSEPSPDADAEEQDPEPSPDADAEEPDQDTEGAEIARTGWLDRRRDLGAWLVTPLATLIFAPMAAGALGLFFWQQGDLDKSPAICTAVLADNGCEETTLSMLGEHLVFFGAAWLLLWLVPWWRGLLLPRVALALAVSVILIDVPIQMAR